MNELILDFGLFSGFCGSNIRWSEIILHKLLEVAVFANTAYLSCKGAPALYESGVKYQREPAGREIFKTIPMIMRDGQGDCEDLACWRVAELRMSGEPANIAIRKYTKPGAPVLFHILVQRGNGLIEDPSKRLGMGSKEIV